MCYLDPLNGQLLLLSRRHQREFTSFSSFSFEVNSSFPSIKVRCQLRFLNESNVSKILIVFTLLLWSLNFLIEGDHWSDFLLSFFFYDRFSSLFSLAWSTCLPWVEFWMVRHGARSPPSAAPSSTPSPPWRWKRRLECFQRVFQTHFGGWGSMPPSWDHVSPLSLWQGARERHSILECPKSPMN